MNAQRDDDRPLWYQAPRELRNFRELAPLTPEAESWWAEFGEKLEAAQREWDGKAR